METFPMTVTQETIEDMFGASIRIEMLIHLPTQCIDASLPSEINSAFRDDWDNIMAELNCLHMNDVDMEDLGDELRRAGKNGFLMQFATPIPISFSEHGYTTGGFGYYTMKWIYAESIQSGCEQALEWQREYIDKERNNSDRGN